MSPWDVAQLQSTGEHAQNLEFNPQCHVNWACQCTFAFLSAPESTQEVEAGGTETHCSCQLYREIVASLRHRRRWRSGVGGRRDGRKDRRRRVEGRKMNNASIHKT